MAKDAGKTSDAGRTRDSGRSARDGEAGRAPAVVDEEPAVVDEEPAVVAHRAKARRATARKLEDLAAQEPQLERISDLLRVAQGPIDLVAAPTRATPGYHGKKADAKAGQAELGERLADLQERLFAEGRTGGRRSVLLVLQGMDTSGKGGTVRHVLGAVDPQGCHIHAFGPPTAEEQRHEFLWRIRQQLPEPGLIGVFDRSHYEDVGVVRVHNLVPRATWGRRYASINNFEERAAASGVRIIKCFLHISKEESRERLLARLDDPTKHWKFRMADIDERMHWEAYAEAYSVALEKCNTEAAPWFLVPADRKWYRNWAITKLLTEQLEEMALTWPIADFDVDLARERLLAGA